MLSKPAARFIRVLVTSNKTAPPIAVGQTRHFSTSKSVKAENRIYTPVRLPTDLASYIALSTSSNKPLLTLWTASYCPSCKHISPLLNDLITSGVGEAEGGVSFCEVEYDSPDVMAEGLGMRYMITSMPTLLAFSRGEPILDTRLMDVGKMKDKEVLAAWIRKEASRRGDGAGPTSIFDGLFGGKK